MKKKIRKIKSLESYPRIELAAGYSKSTKPRCMYGVTKHVGVDVTVINAAGEKRYLVLHRHSGMRFHARYLDNEQTAIRAAQRLGALPESWLTFKLSGDCPYLDKLYKVAVAIFGEANVANSANMEQFKKERAEAKRAKQRIGKQETAIKSTSKKINYSKKTMKELQKEARRLQLAYWYKMSRSELQEALELTVQRRRHLK